MSGLTEVSTSPPSPGGVAATAGQRRKVIVFLAVMLSTLGLDLLSKWWSFETVAGQPVRHVHEAAEDETFWQRYPHDAIVVVPHVLSLRLTTNTGAVFGKGKGMRWVFVVVSILAVFVIGYLLWRSDPQALWLQVALALIMAGALGNLYDRVVYASVRDMFLLFPTTTLWPYIFNVADVALVIGVSLILILSFFAPPSPDEPATPR